MLLTLPCCWITTIQWVLVLAFVVFLLMVIAVKLTTLPHPVIEDFKQERTFLASSKPGADLIPFPSLDDSPEVKLSVVVPAYNEEERLPSMLDECLEFLEGRSSSYEVIIVDDGSKDRTTEVGLEYVDKYGCDKVRVLKLAKNRGKGGAVRMGMLKARGETVLFADADGATTFPDIVKLEDKMNLVVSQEHGIVCGSRAHMEEESIASRTFLRTVLMYGFHLCVWVFAVKTVKDTQCGFKLLTRKSAQIIFKSLHIERWAFDVEMLKVAEMLSIPIGEVSVRWQEIEGSKLEPILDAIQMFRDIFLLWLRYAVGAWKLPNKIE